MIVATMNIKDPEVRRLAAELAARRHTSMTGAVRQALEETLERDRSSRAGMADRLMVIGKEASRFKDDFLTDDDLYDERGLPRLEATGAFPRLIAEHVAELEGGGVVG